MRYNSTFSGSDQISLSDYIDRMGPSQKNIYYVVSTNPNALASSPFLEAFKNSNVPVLLLNNQIDEMCFENTRTYKGHNFKSIESSYEDVAGDLEGLTDRPKSLISEEELANFSLWLKNQLAPSVSKIVISKRLTSTPAMLYGQVSSTMRMMIQMMDQANA